MIRFLYENSASYRGHLIIPFVLGIVEGQPLYSYRVISELGHKGKFHNSENPAEFISSSLLKMMKIAKSHLDDHSDVVSNSDYFKDRYTYHHHLIIIHEKRGKCFYDHYLPEQINNIAAPILFATKVHCMNWVRQGIDRNYATSADYPNIP